MILFTGFPGFIGERLLPRLLERLPEASILCLVQEKFLGKARADLLALEGLSPAVRGRVSLVAGDITAKGLGIDPTESLRVQKSLTGAFHLAAVYDLAVSRELGYRVNVEGTRHVLSFLAKAPRLERLHYVSTAYVSGNATGVFRETDLDQSFKNHYEATKFEAELAVKKSGLPQTIYRPGIVVGDSRTGETGKFDGPYFALRAMERIPSPGLFLRVGSGRSPINLVPVDFIVEALARLPALPGSLGKTYHLTDPHPLSVREVEHLFAHALGKAFVYVPLPKGVAKALFRPKAVQGFFGMPREALDYFDQPCQYDATVATEDLASVGLACPRFPDYVSRLVAFYQEKRGSVRREAMV
jgi:thioester reductase-like protein